MQYKCNINDKIFLQMMYFEWNIMDYYIDFLSRKPSERELLLKNS